MTLSVLRKFPFVTWWLLSLLLASILGACNIQYDARTFGSFLLLTNAIWGFLHWFPMELLRSYTPRGSTLPLEFLGMLTGFTFALLLDLILVTRIRRACTEARFKKRREK